MKVIKFEVSFKSDGSVAGPVARQAEAGWALWDSAGGLPRASGRPRAVGARARVGLAAECVAVCVPAATATSELAGWLALKHCAAWRAVPVMEYEDR